MNMTRGRLLLTGGLGAVLLGATPALSASKEPAIFNRDIRPILAKNCFSCHGQDEKKRKAKLRLDVAEEALSTRKGVTVIVPGNLSKSEMWARIISKNADEQMPPPDSRKTLSTEEKETLKLWIEQGAKYQTHWAFIAPKKPKVPAGVANPIDAFLQQRLAIEGLKPAPLAKQETLVRRVYLDLTGLPPTPKEVDEFLSDKSSNALEKLIARLMKRQTLMRGNWTSPSSLFQSSGFACTRSNLFDRKRRLVYTRASFSRMRFLSAA